MASRQWIKIFTGFLKDEKIHFIIKRYGHDCLTFWMGLLTESHEGVLELPEEIFEETILTVTERYNEIKSIFIKYNLIRIEDGKIVVSNWDKYQKSESFDRVKKHRDSSIIQKNEKRYSNASVTECNGDVTPCNDLVTEKKRVEVEVEVEVDINTVPPSGGGSGEPGKVSQPKANAKRYFHDAYTQQDLIDTFSKTYLKMTGSKIDWSEPNRTHLKIIYNKLQFYYSDPETAAEKVIDATRTIFSFYHAKSSTWQRPPTPQAISQKWDEVNLVLSNWKRSREVVS